MGRGWLELLLDSIANGGPWPWDAGISLLLDAAAQAEQTQIEVDALLAERDRLTGHAA